MTKDSNEHPDGQQFHQKLDIGSKCCYSLFLYFTFCPFRCFAIQAATNDGLLPSALVIRRYSEGKTPSVHSPPFFSALPLEHTRHRTSPTCFPLLVPEDNGKLAWNSPGAKYGEVT